MSVEYEVKWVAYCGGALIDSGVHKAPVLRTLKEHLTKCVMHGRVRLVRERTSYEVIEEHTVRRPKP